MEGIIYKAIRELEIEETVADIVSTWDATAFVVLRYYTADKRTEVVQTSSDCDGCERRRSVDGDSQLGENNNRPNNGDGQNNSEGRSGDSAQDEGTTLGVVVVASTAVDDNDDGNGDSGEVVVTTTTNADLKR